MEEPATTNSGEASSGSRGSRRVLHVAAIAAAGYLVIAYGVLPLFWTEHEHQLHPVVKNLPPVAVNAQGIPGDPLNVGLIGTREELVSGMVASGWRPAEALGLRSDFGIAESVLLDRPDPEAPVSSLFVFQRRQDLAFEQEDGPSADRRHHVRFWQAPQSDPSDRPFWVGTVSFDRGSGLSHRTGEITHHIDPEVDTERDFLMSGLEGAGCLLSQTTVPGCGPTRDGRNAGGDRYVTDGQLRVGVLRSAPPGGSP